MSFSWGAFNEQLRYASLLEAILLTDKKDDLPHFIQLIVLIIQGKLPFHFYFILFLSF